MDTILYFMKKRGLQEPEIEPVGLKTYLLVRIRLDVERETWFGKKLGHANRAKEKDDCAVEGYACSVKEKLPCASEGGYSLAGMEDSKPEVRKSLIHWVWRLSHPIQQWRKNKRSKAEKRIRQEYEYRFKREEELRLAMKEQMLAEIEASMRKLAVQVQELVGDMNQCYCVYEDSLRRALIGRKAVGRKSGVLESNLVSGAGPVDAGLFPEEKFSEEEIMRRGDFPERDILYLPALWERYFPIVEFTAYNQGFWVEQLLAQAVQSHFLILGTAPCLCDVIEAHVHRMKSLRWILPREACDEELSGFVEDFYTEYGLAIILQPMENMAILKRQGLVCKEPLNILDFTGETYVAVPQVPEGSVWLDMLSVEEKRRAVLAKGKGIVYFSLKEKWKSAQKRCNCPVLP